MQVQHRYFVSSSLSRTVQAHRDDVSDYGACFPGIASVALGDVSRTAEGRLAVDQLWSGDTRWIPAPLRSLIGADVFRWVIETRWGGDDCDWRLVVPVLGDQPLITGRYDFRRCDGGTEVDVAAELDFDGEAVASRLGVGPLQRLLIPALERFVGMLFTTVMSRSSTVIANHVSSDERVAA